MTFRGRCSANPRNRGRSKKTQERTGLKSGGPGVGAVV